MRNRPRTKYLKKMRREDPPTHIKDELMEAYHNGGVPVEPQFVPKIGDKTRFAVMSGPRDSKSLGNWTYVGQGWWCLGGHSFARLMAVQVVEDKVCVAGPWDEHKHGFMDPPVIVYDSNGNKGHIVGYNEFEVFISWYDPKLDRFCVRVPYSNLEGIRFEYKEDFNKYSGIVG